MTVTVCPHACFHLYFHIPTFPFTLPLVSCLLSSHLLVISLIMELFIYSCRVVMVRSLVLPVFLSLLRIFICTVIEFVNKPIHYLDLLFWIQLILTKSNYNNERNRISMLFLLLYYIILNYNYNIVYYVIIFHFYCTIF